MIEGNASSVSVIDDRMRLIQRLSVAIARLKTT